jgi:TonB family protein
MLHGTQAYFLERARCSRRTALTTVAVALALSAVLLAAQHPVFRRALDRWPMRFGFEGPEHFVRRVTLDTEPRAPLRTENGVRFRTRASSRGGRIEAENSRSPRARPETRQVRMGAGASEDDMMARARELHQSSQVFHSEELVIERLVNPEYPEEARAKGIEGPVVLVAHVSETGSVIGVEVMESDGERQLELAAAAAVWQCRFRPYQSGGRPQDVYAVFHFRFRLY